MNLPDAQNSPKPGKISADASAKSASNYVERRRKLIEILL